MKTIATILVGLLLSSCASTGPDAIEQSVAKAIATINHDVEEDAE